jgi:hypothetical protein
MGTASRSWTEQTVHIGDETLPLLTQQQGDRLLAVPARPLLARGPDGRPKLALTLGLRHKPSVDEPSLEPLVTYGLLGLTATLALPANSNADSSAAFTPLFARRATFSLRGAEALTLQQVTVLGTDASAAFSLALDREGALQALAAVRGNDSQLTVRCELDYQLATEATRLHLAGSYGSMYAALMRYGTKLDRPAIETGIADALESGALRADPAPLSQVVAAFLKIAGPILRVQDSLYSLRKPWSDAPFDMTIQVSEVPSTRTLELSCTLDQLLAGALTPENATAILQLIVPDEQGLPAPLARRVEQRATRAASPPTAAGVGKLARLGTSASALSVFARPELNSKLNAHLQLQDAGVRLSDIIASGRLHWFVDDLSVLLPAQPVQARSLPRVNNAQAHYFPDHRDPALHWYAPEYTPDPAAANGDPSSSPFLFVFRTNGHTPAGKVGLDGSVRIRIRPSMSAATLSAWQAAGKFKIAPVAVKGLSATLSIPFRDQRGATRSQEFAATLTAEGDTYLVEVALLDDWLRLAYGALSTPDYQATGAVLKVVYSFEAYVPVQMAEVSLVMDAKLATLRTYADDPIGPAAGSYLNTTELTYNTPVAQLKWSREKRAALASGQRLSTKIDKRNDFVIRPELEASDKLTQPIAERRYGVQSVLRVQPHNVIYPCQSLGAFYLQESGDGARQAIGCRDAFKLGQTDYKQYQRVSDLDDPDFSVWCSLQQPGHFLLVPQRWAIARFAADDATRAYRPAILVYSTVDASVPENNRGVLLASLIPDISSAKLRALDQKLASRAQTPILSLVNAIEAETSFAWPLPASSGIEQRTVKLFDSFQVTLVCALDVIPQLQTMLQGTGIVGSVQYQLPDGTSISASVSLDLNHIVGPAPNGPVEARLLGENSECELTNRIERAVDVIDLLVDLAADGGSRNLRVEQRLESGASIRLPLPPGAAGAIPNVNMAPGDAAELTEVRSFVEDVHTSIGFINLLNFANHNLSHLVVQARIRELPDTRTLTLNDAAPIGTLEFVLPLTRYLANPEVEYVVTRVALDGTSSTCAFRTWSLATQGNMISLSWDSIQ